MTDQTLTFRDELQRAAEYSKARLTMLRPVIHKFMAQSISTLSTTNLNDIFQIQKLQVGLKKAYANIAVRLQKGNIP